MEPVTISLFILSGISFLLHGLHLNNNYRCGGTNSCCQCSGDIEEIPPTTTQLLLKILQPN
jgi:hypothetical protein